MSRLNELGPVSKAIGRVDRKEICEPLADVWEMFTLVAAH